MQSNSLEDGRPRPSRERERNHSVAVHCSRRHGSARRAVRSRRKFPMCSSVPSVVTHQHRGHRGTCSSRATLERLLLFRRNRQPKNRRLPLPRNIQSGHRFRIGQVERFAVLTPIYLGIFSPSLLRVSTSLLQHISCVIPAFKMPATKFALSIVFIAGALPRLLDLDFMVWKLLR